MRRRITIKKRVFLGMMLVGMVLLLVACGYSNGLQTHPATEFSLEIFANDDRFGLAHLETNVATTDGSFPEYAAPLVEELDAWFVGTN